VQNDQKRDGLAEDYESLYRSYVALLRQVEQLSTLREIGLAINSTLELDDALKSIANVVQGALDVQRLTIFVLDKETRVARPVIAKYGRDLIEKARLQEDAVPLDGSPLGRALDSHAVVITSDAYQSSACVPLIATNTPVGVMRLDGRGDGAAFTQDDTELFQLLGSQIAIAINNAQLYALAVTDGLTQLYVRRYFDLRMQEEFHEAKRYARRFAVMLLDIDHFKKVNDAHGHQTGDVVLQQFAGLIRGNTRKSDVCCRYGGEELAVILPGTGLDEGAVLANKLCARIRSHAFTGSDGQGLSITASIGVAEFCDAYEAPEHMVKAVDDALYRAKEGGRNRVELAE